MLFIGTYYYSWVILIPVKYISLQLNSIGDKMSMKIDTKRIKKGLEPLIAAIILIAITIVIATAVAAWITGVFGTSMGGSEQLHIYPNTTLKRIGNEWWFNFTVANKGSVTSNITAVIVGGCNMNITSDIEIGPGDIKTIETKANISDCKFANGVTYQVQIFTMAGNVFYAVVTAGK